MDKIIDKGSVKVYAVLFCKGDRTLVWFEGVYSERNKALAVALNQRLIYPQNFYFISEFDFV